MRERTEGEGRGESRREGEGQKGCVRVCARERQIDSGQKEVEGRR